MGRMLNIYTTHIALNDPWNRPDTIPFPTFDQQLTVLLKCAPVVSSAGGY